MNVRAGLFLSTMEKVTWRRQVSRADAVANELVSTPYVRVARGWKRSKSCTV